MANFPEDVTSIVNLTLRIEVACAGHTCYQVLNRTTDTFFAKTLFSIIQPLVKSVPSIESTPSTQTLRIDSQVYLNHDHTTKNELLPTPPCFYACCMVFHPNGGGIQASASASAKHEESTKANFGQQQRLQLLQQQQRLL